MKWITRERVKQYDLSGNPALVRQGRFDGAFK